MPEYMIYIYSTHSVDTFYVVDGDPCNTAQTSGKLPTTDGYDTDSGTYLHCMIILILMKLMYGYASLVSLTLVKITVIV
jgi:hypothetical protein